MARGSRPQAGAQLRIGLFPLPGVVLFPGLPLPLHVFEPRYRALTRSALDGDRVFGMILPDPAAAALPSGLPGLHAVGTLGRIVRAEPYPDGRFDVLLTGVARFRLLEESGVDAPYRTARVEVLPDADPLAPDEDLRRCLRSVRAAGALLSPGFREETLPEAMPPGVLAGAVAGIARLPDADRQALLEEGDGGTRCRRLLAMLEPFRGRLDRARALRRMYSRGWERAFPSN